MTIRDIAEKAGVSPATVSIVLNEKKGVSEETRTRVQEIIDSTGYQPAARKKNSTKMILLLMYVNNGILVEENQGFISIIFNSMRDALKRHGYGVVSLHAGDDMDHVISEIDFSAYEGVCVVASEMPESMYGCLKKIPIPFVVIDNMMPGYPYPCVGIDNAENVRLALKYCRKCGIQNLGYLKSSFEAENFRARTEAFLKFADEYKFHVDSSQIYSLDPTLRGAHHDMRILLESGKTVPECFFADNDMIALGAMTCLKEHGYRIPEDVSIIGFDNIPYSGVSSPTLATVNVRREVIGRAAADTLLIMMKNGKNAPVKLSIVGEIKPRKSVKRK